MHKKKTSQDELKGIHQARCNLSWMSVCSHLPQIDPTTDHRFTRAGRVTYFSPSERELLMQEYKKVKDIIIIIKKGNTAMGIKVRVNLWQNITECLKA